ncbi:hypothetical protein BC941DRAFT_438454 [Chlamydoabsidia padenii]|nr:hypothetical protein BC941DRAFT_438454 [Chlamydoabsidia padenii]
MDIHQAPSSSAPTTHHSTQPHSNLTITPSPQEPSLATIHEDGSPSTHHSPADDLVRPTYDNNKSGTDLLSSGWMNLSGPFDKRKSSPAILGLPFGITDDPQLDLHLSRHRNSIEAAVLLASFNRVPAKEHPIKAHSRQWQDDLSIAAQTQPKSTETAYPRRHSYDVNMTWKSMPREFKERTDSFNTSSAFKPVSSKPPQNQHPHTTGQDGFKSSRITWTQDGFYQATTSTSAYPPPRLTPISPYPPRLLHPTSSLVHPLAPTDPPGMKRVAYDHGTTTPYPYGPPPPYYGPDSPHPSMSKLPLPGQLHGYPQPYHPPPHLLPVNTPEEYAAYQEQASSSNRSKRKRMIKEPEEIVEAGDADFPTMCPRDVELARTDPQARPRRQKTRFDGDLYTPKWVRFNGQAKEGLCDTCQPGRWLQLKNSAYWYHKQFFHGISSVSGLEFVPPAETRWVDQDLVEGLCHQCRHWVAVSNVKRKNSVLWFRHAHKCHLYNKQKNATGQLL